MHPARPAAALEIVDQLAAVGDVELEQCSGVEHDEIEIGQVVEESGEGGAELHDVPFE